MNQPYYSYKAADGIKMLLKKNLAGLLSKPCVNECTSSPF